MVHRRPVDLRVSTCNMLVALSCAAPCMLAGQAPRNRDSAGVHIVETGPRATAPIAFRLSDKPSFDVGGLKDNPDDELSQRGGYIRSIVLSNGTHVVSDDNKLRFFDASGKQFRVTGRGGAGPGEFRQIGALCRTRGDTIVANDQGNARVTIFDKMGSIIGQYPVGRAFMPSEGCFDDGTWILDQRGTSVSDAPMTRYNLAGTALGSAGDYWAGTFDLFVSMTATFSVHGSHLYVGDPRANEVKVYDQAGKLTGVIRTSDPRVSTTASERAAMLPLMMPMSDDQAIMDRFKERLRTAPRPTEWPAYQRVAVDPDGRLWIAEYQRTRTDPLLWTAFDASGRLLGKLSFPPSIKPGDPRIVDFTAGGVEIRREDSDGAVHLTTYPLIPVRGGHQ